MNTYQGEGTSPGRKFQLKVIITLIWDLFSNGIIFLAYAVTFS